MLIISFLCSTLVLELTPLLHRSGPRHQQLVQDPSPSSLTPSPLGGLAPFPHRVRWHVVILVLLSCLFWGGACFPELLPKQFPLPDWHSFLKFIGTQKHGRQSRTEAFITFILEKYYWIKGHEPHIVKTCEYWGIMQSGNYFKLKKYILKWMSKLTHIWDLSLVINGKPVNDSNCVLLHRDFLGLAREGE